MNTVVNPMAPFGFILMENDTTFQEVKNLDVVKQDHLFFVRFDTILQSLDCINRNRRYYRGDSIHQPIVKPEFMFDQFIMSSAKKRYIVGPSLKDRLSQNIRDGISGDVQCIPENTTQ